MAKNISKAEKSADVAEPVAKKPAKKKFESDELILCTSVTHGELNLLGKKSGLQYIWANVGDTAEVEYQDLQALYATKSRFLVDPLFMIEDEELVDQWKSMLKPIYDKIASQDLDAMLQLPPERLRVSLERAPKGIRHTIVTLAAEKIQSGELDSMNRIKVIDEVLGVELAKTFT